MQIKNKKALKGVSKVVVKHEINHNDYANTIETGESLNRVTTSIRSFNHELFTHVQENRIDSLL